MADDPGWTPKQDMSLLCRVCANQHDYLIPIFEGEGLDHDMPTKMDKHLPIKVRENDKLPTQMCYQCASTIIAWSELVTNCLEADKKLSRMLKINEKKSLTDAMADEDANSDHYEDTYDDVGGGGDDAAADDEDFEKEIKQLISDAGVELVSKSTKAKTIRTSTRKRKSETVTVKKESKKSKTDSSVSKSSTSLSLIKPKEEVVTSSDDRWVCCKCNANFSSCLELTFHGIEEHGAQYDDPYLCVLCFQSLNEHSYQQELVFYVDEELSDQFVCDLCGMKFDEKVDLAKHIAILHSQMHLTKTEDYSCDSLKKRSVSKRESENDSSMQNSKEDHVLGQSTSYAFLCYVCKKKYKAESDYLYHMKKCCATGEETLTAILEEMIKKAYESSHFVCFFCNKNFASEELVRAHLLSMHTSEANGDEYSVPTHDESKGCDLRCKLCANLFDSIFHMNTHLCGDDEKCTFCEEKFKELGSLWSHMFQVHRNKTLTCTSCSTVVRLRNETDLVEHFLIKHMTIMKISVSGKSLKNKILKESSRIIVDGREKFLCKECPSVVTSFSSLTRHMAYAHCDDTPYACDRCTKAFKTKNKLRIHLNSVHERTRSHKCQFCGREFAISSNLTNHLRIHTGEKPYVCDECGMNFTQSASLYSHKITHKQDACHVCPYCNKGFLRAHQLRNHISHVHLGILPPKSHVCEVCGIGFRCNGQLRRHRETHSTVRSFACEQCNAAFTMKKYLVQHFKVHRLS